MTFTLVPNLGVVQVFVVMSYTETCATTDRWCLSCSYANLEGADLR